MFIIITFQMANMDTYTDEIDKITNSIEKLNLNTINYSEILYYSIIFDKTTYELILNKLLNYSFLKGMYKYKSIDEIYNILQNIEIEKEDVNKFESILKKLTPNDNFTISTKKITNNGTNINLYKLNDKLHTTILYTGGKVEPNAYKIEPFVGKETNLMVKSFGISDDFIVCGIELVDKAIPYYGNLIQHITIGLRKSDKKLFPKDSPTAFENGVKIILNEPFEITGKIIKEIKEIKEIKNNKEKSKKNKT